MSKLTWLVPVILLFNNACTKKETSGSADNTAADAAVSEAVAKGQVVYQQYCVACHMKDGLGAPPMNPPLAGTSLVKGDKSLLIPIVLKGMSGQAVDGQKYHNVMPPLDFLTDDQIADVLTYVRNSFGNKGEIISSAQVKALR